MWIPIRSSSYKDTVLTNYQAVLDPNKPLAAMSKTARDKAWVIICKEIKIAIDLSVPQVEQKSQHPSTPDGLTFSSTSPRSAKMRRRTHRKGKRDQDPFEGLGIWPCEVTRSPSICLERLSAWVVGEEFLSGEMGPPSRATGLARMCQTVFSDGPSIVRVPGSRLCLRRSLPQYTLSGILRRYRWSGNLFGNCVKGRRLAELIGQRRTLLILDGLEPLKTHLVSLAGGSTQGPWPHRSSAELSS